MPLVKSCIALGNTAEIDNWRSSKMEDILLVGLDTVDGAFADTQIACGSHTVITRAVLLCTIKTIVENILMVHQPVNNKVWPPFQSAPTAQGGKSITVNKTTSFLYARNCLSLSPSLSAKRNSCSRQMDGAWIEEVGGIRDVGG